MSRFLVLDSFRGISAISVAVFHIHVLGGFSEYEFFRGSAIFVDFFFVLSGFVFFHCYGRRKQVSIRDFTLTRVARIYPLHILTLILFLCIEFTKLLVSDFGINLNNVPFSGNNDSSYILSNALLLQSWIGSVPHESFNYPSWSISVEFYVYFIFLITLFLKQPIRYFSWLSLIAFSIFLHKIEFIEDVISRGIMGFFIGCFTYIIYSALYKSLNVNKLYWSIVEFTMIFLMVNLVSGNIPYRDEMAYLIFPVTIIVFSFEKGYMSEIFKHKTLIYSGKISFSVYMLHAFVLQVVYFTFMVLDKVVDRDVIVYESGVRFIDLGSKFNNNILLIVVLSFIIMTSIVINKYVEDYFYKKIKLLNKFG
ncbi:acyltransferase family protein [Vibrio fortis]|uniref:acyltransferase family protein n=1 Tax=Vibrio fortis TaxID=212667 RepID=UPI004068CE13